MKTLVRIVKREKAESSELSHQEAEERRAPTQREIASTIKSWIKDREERRRMTERTNRELLIKFAQ